LIATLAMGLLFSGAAGDGVRSAHPKESVPFSFLTSDSLFQVGEELTYNVSYASINLGQVRIRILERDEREGAVIYRASALIDSYKGLPLVDLHAIFESQIDASIYARSFWCRIKDDDRWKTYAYDFAYPKRAIYVETGIWKPPSVEKRDTVRIDTLYQDGLSLFFFARKHLHERQTYRIPTFVNEKKGSTLIQFTNERQKESIDAVDYPIDVVYFKGEAGFVGVYGLSGDFEGWFSNDAARVPILAKMKVLIGKVRIELMEWKRAGWEPPRYAGRQ
jgi:hypothetical protein